MRRRTGQRGMRESLRIVLADGQNLFVDALTAALERAGHRVVATATTRCALLEAIRRRQPDVVVIDSCLSDGDAIAAIVEIGAVEPAPKVILLTADGGHDMADRALEAGASGFIHKSHGLPAVLEMLHRVTAGGTVTATSISPPGGSGASGHYVRQLALYLTPRELECLRLLALGLDTREVARRLSVSTPTVRSHVQAVLGKLGVHSRMEAASLAIRYGLVDSDAGDAARGLSG